MQLREGQAPVAGPDGDHVGAPGGLVAQDVRYAEGVSQHEVNSITAVGPAQAVSARNAAMSSSTSGSSVG